ncbi:GHMP family kinase ATP-binding protein [Micromonospora lutea]|uniref:GHMP family kinase ATP-binding protein n=1 Tax=Micromonospora lutea TaxID=419825 RepID=UPI001EF22C7A|nr:kinase [Micromonospora lutea]
MLQGVLPEEERHFLVTLPIAGWAHAAFHYLPDSPEVAVRPSHKTKARRLATRLLRTYGISGGGMVELDGALPEGKGLASSSADLVATARAIADAIGIFLDAAAIECLLRDVEPSDGVMYPGIVSYHHREVRVREELGFLPPLTILAHDVGGMVDTIRFNRSTALPPMRVRHEYRTLLDEMSAAVRTGDLATVGRIATRSAELHVQRHPRADFAQMRRLCHEVGGLGLAIAHSGTYLGILLGEHREGEERTTAALARCAELPGEVRVFRTLGVADYPPCPLSSGTRAGAAKG